MIASGHLYGGGPLIRKYKLGATMADPGIVMIGNATHNIVPCTTTSFADAFGLALDEGVYSTTQGDAEGIVTVSARPDLIIKALASGGATEGTALTTHTNTSASSGGTTVTAATLSSNDMDGGTVWCISGNNVGHSRSITTFTASTSLAVTVPFPRAIAVNDQFLVVPWNQHGTGAAGADGIRNVQTSTLFTQADASIASGTGGEVCVVDLDLKGASDSYVYFVLRLHVAASASIAS